MFQFFFKYPSAVFRKGQFVLLSPWPAWVLVVLIAAATGGLALVIRWRLREAAPRLRSWRAGLRRPEGAAEARARPRSPAGWPAA